MRHFKLAIPAIIVALDAIAVNFWYWISVIANLWPSQVSYHFNLLGGYSSVFAI